MSDATNPPLSEEQERQAREYLAQLRAAPVEQVLTEVLSGLLSAAQAKLGRRDARLLIDVNGLVIAHVRRYLSPELAKQLDQLLGQLRLGQVQAERAQSRQAPPGQSQSGQEQPGQTEGSHSPAGPEPNDLAEVPEPPVGGEAGSESPTAAPRPSAAPGSGLWVPGR